MSEFRKFSFFGAKKIINTLFTSIAVPPRFSGQYCRINKSLTPKWQLQPKSG